MMASGCCSKFRCGPFRRDGSLKRGPAKRKRQSLVNRNLLHKCNFSVHPQFSHQTEAFNNVAKDTQAAYGTNSQAATRSRFHVLAMKV